MENHTKEGIESMKKFRHILIMILVLCTVLVTPVIASETCDLSDGTDCEIWWMYDAEGHWRACVNHRDQNGNDTPVTVKEAHVFEDGACTICEAKESKGASMYSYLFVFVVVVGLSTLIPMRAQKSFKKNNFEERPFGLDKFRKF